MWGLSGLFTLFYIFDFGRVICCHLSRTAPGNETKHTYFVAIQGDVCDVLDFVQGYHRSDVDYFLLPGVLVL